LTLPAQGVEYNYPSNEAVWQLWSWYKSNERLRNVRRNSGGTVLRLRKLRLRTASLVLIRTPRQWNMLSFFIIKSRKLPPLAGEVRRGL